MGETSFGIKTKFHKRRQIKHSTKRKNLAPPAGLEPATYGLTVHRSTD